MKVKVITSDRGQFIGTVIGETSSFYKVTHDTNKEIGEWLPKYSKNIKCVEQES